MLMEGAFSEMCPIGEHVTNTLQVRYSLATLSFMLPSQPPDAQPSLDLVLVPHPCLCVGLRRLAADTCPEALWMFMKGWK